MPEAIYRLKSQQFLPLVYFGHVTARSFRRSSPEIIWIQTFALLLRNLRYPHEFIKNIVGIQSFVIAKAFMPEAIHFFITIIFGLPRRFAPCNDIESIEFYLKQADFFE